MKYVLILLAALAFVGCDGQSQSWNDEDRVFYKVRNVDARGDFTIFCDRSTNIAYLRYSRTNYFTGFTVYYNSDGRPARCDEVRK